MKIDFLGLPHQERLIYFTQAAIRQNLSPVILEKDFWVCWLLGLLFESKFSDSLVFKGGTSLSKVFGVIALADHPKAKEAQCNDSLRDRVVEWKSHFFGSSWANYKQAKPGSFRLVPSTERKSALRRDYQAMRDMYLVESPDFDVVIEKLTLLENRINRVDHA